MPLYGRGFTLSDATKNGFYASAPNPIPAGPYTQQAGTWGFNEASETQYLITLSNIEILN